jgi:prevent-host-death family protein
LTPYGRRVTIRIKPDLVWFDTIRLKVSFMIIDTITEAKAQLSALVSAVEQGEEVIIKRSGNPVAILKQYEKNKKPRVPGALAGKIVIHKDFDQLPDDLMDAFGMVGESMPSYTTGQDETED